MSEVVNDRPNLFRWATKELSQDAVICWLIDWAGFPRSASAGDEKLRQCGRAFLDALFAKWKDWPVELGHDIRTEVCQQEQGIDVLARVDCRYVLLIEDKTGTRPHDEQLKRYWDDLMGGKTSFGAVRPEHAYPIYFKTGNQARSEARRINEGWEGWWRVFERCDFLGVLETYDGDDRILKDYRAYLRELEARTNSYELWKEGDDRKAWDPLGWEGLYQRLEDEMPSWVGNIHQRGGFYGLWGRPSSAAPETWLEFGHYGGGEQRHQLAFKLEVPDADLRKEQREWWCGALMATGRGNVTRPQRIGLGKTMTVGLWVPFLAFDEEDGSLDVSGTVRQIQEAERVLEEVSRDVSQRRNGTWAE